MRRRTSKTSKTSKTRTIADRLLAKAKRMAGARVVDLGSRRAGRAHAEELQRTVANAEALGGLHPTHAAYVLAQNQASVMAELLTSLDEMDPFVHIIEPAQNLYGPVGPPMSPLTGSYFTCWAMFDVCVGPADETIGTTIVAVGRDFGMHPSLLEVVDALQRSRMGLYIQRGVQGDAVVLEELVTGAVCTAIVPCGYRGRRGELWYARVLPPPPALGTPEHVVFTTPYVLLQPGLPAWEAYFRRVLPGPEQGDRLEAYARHMKFGPSRSYWNDFVFEGYVNHVHEAVFLAGLPDIPESRPHFEA